MMRELSLFSGAGGGLLGTYLLGWTPIGYVEYDDYCQRVIRQRIIDGILPNAPIFGDVRAFLREEYAAAYTGLVDVITGGFPCQPFSVAGKQRGTDDERNMWPATVECIRIIRPRYAFLENVPGILSSGYFGTILGDLAESGYDARWRILSAAEVGAPHKRDRLWIVAYADRNGGNPGESTGRRNGSIHRQDRQTASANGIGGKRDDESRQDGSNGHVADANQEQRELYKPVIERQLWQRNDISRGSWWEVEPPLGRVVDGYAGRVAELQAAGNAQVASVAATAWHLLTEGL